jgi:hypothetical protein
MHATLFAGGVHLNIGGSVHDPSDPVGRLLFTTLSMIAEFEADLARARTREGMAVARAKGRLRGKQPKLSPRQEAHLVELYRAGQHTIGELEELFPVTRSTIYRAVARGRANNRDINAEHNAMTDRVGRTTRGIFRDLMTNSTVGAISTAFQDEGRGRSDCRYEDSSVRRQTTQSYLDAVDCTDPRHVGRFLRVAERLLNGWQPQGLKPVSPIATP